MIEGMIPKDIRKYEAKLIGPFTTRQVIFGVASCIVAYFAYKAGKTAFDSSTALTISMFAAFPLLAFAQVKPYGMTLEKFLKTAFIGMVLAPKVRKYKTINIYKEATEKIAPMSDKEYRKRKKKEKALVKKNPDFQSFK